MILCKNTTITSQFLNCQECFFKEIVLVERKSSQGIAIFFFHLALFWFVFLLNFFFINLIYFGTLQEHNPYFLALSRKPTQTISAFGEHEKWRFGASFFFFSVCYIFCFFICIFLFFHFSTIFRKYLKKSETKMIAKPKEIAETK